MPRQTTVLLRDQHGDARGCIVIASLPRGPALPRYDDGSIGLREGAVYHYAIEDLVGEVVLEPAELFDADDGSCRYGRMRPGQSVGWLAITARQLPDGPRLSGVIAVAPTKLDQVREYRQMLEDIADHAAEAVLQGFAPSTLDVVPSSTPAELLYQRFAVLEARLRSPEFAAAMSRVLHEPHREWESRTQSQPIGTSYPAGSAFQRALSMPGPRRSWGVQAHPALETLPLSLVRDLGEETFNTAPNRFVKWALQCWLDIAASLVEVLDRVEGQVTSGPIRRGREAALAVVAQLDEILGHRLFNGLGHFDGLHTANQVLLKRSGYREIFQTFALIDAGVAVRFDKSNIDDVYSPSLRNVATLYELWCFLTLADVVGDVCGDAKTAHAFAPTGDGLSLTLRAGHASAIRWNMDVGGRLLDIELYFNRQFSVVRGGLRADGSWSDAMRPDCSLRVRPLTNLPGDGTDLDVWIHFDAKYRVDGLAEQLSSPDDESHEAGATTRVKREDLLKMHAYRDAIHRSGGAYVLYPGTEERRLERYTELLPGLGAFPLRPGAESGTGVSGLRRFVTDVMKHVAQQASIHERSRFWNAAINSAATALSHDARPVPFLDRPPADTEVLFGYVRGQQHQEWIQRTRSYNIRADDRAGAVPLNGRQLSATLLLLYRAEAGALYVIDVVRLGAWRVADRNDLLNSGYPEPGGRLYYLATWEPVEQLPEWLSRIDVAALRPAGTRFGEPFNVTWWDLLAHQLPAGGEGAETR